MRINKSVYAVFFMMTANVFLSAQSNVYDIDRAINTALQNNKEVTIAKLNIEKSEAAVSEAFGYALPSVDVTANLAHMLAKPKTAFPDFTAMLTNASYNILFEENVIPRDNSKFLPMNSKLQSFALTNSFETKAQITQVLFSSAVFRGIGASKIYLDLAKTQYQSVSATTILNTKKAFYGVLLSQQLLEILESSLKNANENLANIKALNAQGFTSDFDALQVEVQVENIKPAVKELENVLANAKNNLKLLLGIDQQEDIEVAGSFNFEEEVFPDKSELSLFAVKNNLNLNSLRIKKEVDDEFINLERANYWPTLAAFGNYTYAGSSDNWNFLTYGSSVIGLTFSINLFQGGRTANRIDQAQISSMQTQEQITLTEDVIHSQTSSKLNDINKVRTQIKALTRNVELAQKVYDIATTRYKEGTGTQLEIKNADVELRSAKTNLIKAKHDYIIAKAELDNLLGKIETNYPATAN